MTSNRQEEKLQPQDAWDYEKAKRQKGAKPTRVVVSVAFSRDDFEQVAACAEKEGLQTSEFIRKLVVTHST